MKKAQQITLNGVVFSIENDAYNLLEKYLKEVGEYFEKTMGETGREVLNDIESGISEKVIDREKSVSRAITFRDIKAIIKEMGTVDELIENDENIFFDDKEDIVKNTIIKNDIKNKYKISKKLYRDTENKMIAGVSGGLAKFFDIDVVVVRIVFILFFWLSGLSFLVYIILWIIVPKATAPSEKMAMIGEKVSLESVRGFVGERIDEIPKYSEKKIEKASKKDIFKNKVWSKGEKEYFEEKNRKSIALNILIIIKKIIGIIIVIITSAILFTIVSLIMIMFFGSSEILTDTLTSEYFNNIFGDTNVYIILTSFFFIVFTPIWFIFRFGVYLVDSRKKDNWFFSIFLMIFFVISAMILNTFFVKNIKYTEKYISDIGKEIKSDNNTFYIKINGKSLNLGEKIVDIEWNNKKKIISDNK